MLEVIVHGINGKSFGKTTFAGLQLRDRRILTMSGVVGAFRTSTLIEVGPYRPEMATEDIDMTWKLQCDTVRRVCVSVPRLWDNVL